MINTKDSIVSQYNKSGRDYEVLKELQQYFKENGTKVIVLNGEDFTLQKNNKLNEKVLNITKKNLILHEQIIELPDNYCKLAVIRLLELEIIQTNKIENIEVNQNSVSELLNGQGKEKKYREQQIVEHYQKAIKNELKITDAKDISNLYYNYLHAYMEQDDIDAMGKLFRKESVVVMSSKDKVIHTGIEGEDNIEAALDSLLDYLNNSDDDILIKISVFHYLFGYIHPFYEGNGRMSRLITAMYLYPEISFASLAISDTIETNKKVYENMFEETNSSFNVNDMTSFVFQILDFIDQALNKLVLYLNSITTNTVRNT